MNYGSLEQILRNVKRLLQRSSGFGDACDFVRRNPRRCAGDGEGAWSERCADNTGFKYLETILFLRQSLDIEYPLGTDLIFVTPEGEIICFPRLCRAEK